MEKIRTSIVVVTFNCEDVIEENILSCIGEETAELIIIDNASKDATVDRISPFISEKLTLLKNKENKGFTYACNQGIKKASGEFILLLNPDASLEPTTLNLLIKKLEDNPSLGAVAPCLYYPDGSFQNYTRTFPTVMGLWVENFVPKRFWNRFKSYREYTCQDIDFSVEQEVEQPAGAALLFRNSWKLDEGYFIYGSDVDLCKTIKEAGFKIIQTPAAQVKHYQSKGGTENQEIRPMLDADNYFGTKYYFLKFDQKKKYYSYLFSFGASLLGRMVLAVFQGKSQLILRYKKFKYFIKNENFRTLNVK